MLTIVTGMRLLTTFLQTSAGMLLLVVLFPVRLIQKPPTGTLSCMLLIICNVRCFFILGKRAWLHFVFHFSIFLLSTGTFFLRGLFFSAFGWCTLHFWREQTFYITMWAGSAGYRRMQVSQDLLLCLIHYWTNSSRIKAWVGYRTCSEYTLPWEEPTEHVWYSYPLLQQIPEGFASYITLKGNAGQTLIN